MSNLIKYPFVNLSGKEAYVIDSNDEKSSFVAFSQKADTIPEVEEIAASKPEEESLSREETENFSTDMNLVNMDAIIEDERAKGRELAQEIIDKAREEASNIIETANQDAESIRTQAYEDGRGEGYTAGVNQAQAEMADTRQELEENERNRQQEYNEILQQIEPKYVDVLISLIEKITGVIYEDNKDIIVYLLKNSLENLDHSSHYKIKMPSEDIYLVDSQKSELKDIVGEEVSLELVEDKSLTPGQCVIETDTQMVDCGFVVQRENLIETLKLLVL